MKIVPFDMKLRVVLYDIEKAKKIALDVVKQCPYVDENDERNDIVVVSLADSGVEMETRAWVDTPDYWNAFYYLTETIKVELEKNDIVIPYNQLEVHISNNN